MPVTQNESDDHTGRDVPATLRASELRDTQKPHVYSHIAGSGGNRQPPRLYPDERVFTCRWDLGCETECYDCAHGTAASVKPAVVDASEHEPDYYYDPHDGSDLCTTPPVAFSTVGSDGTTVDHWII